MRHRGAWEASREVPLLVSAKPHLGAPSNPKPVCGFCAAMEAGSCGAMEEDMMRRAESEINVAWRKYMDSLQAQEDDEEKLAPSSKRTRMDAARGEAYFRGWEDGRSMFMEEPFWDDDGCETEQEQQLKKKRRTTHKWWWRGYCFAKMKYANVAPSAVMKDQSAGGWEEESSRCFEAWELPGASLQAWEKWDERVAEEDLQQRDGDLETPPRGAEESDQQRGHTSVGGLATTRRR